MTPDDLVFLESHFGKKKLDPGGVDAVDYGVQGLTFAVRVDVWWCLAVVAEYRDLLRHPTRMLGSDAQCATVTARGLGDQKEDSLCIG